MEKDLKNKIIILGGGITGLTLALELSRKHKDRVMLLEKDAFVGGLASTLSKDGISFDLGSHRLHRDASKKVIRYIEEIIKGKLLKRERKGRLYLRKRFLTYPPNLFDFLKAFSSREIIGFFRSYIQGFLFGLNGKNKNFENLMIRKAGKEIYEVFYKDYAKKLWGKEPADIAVDSIKRRKIFLDFRFFNSVFFKNHNYFFYPRQGIGELAKKLRDEVINNGAEIVTGADIKSISTHNNKVSRINFRDCNGADVGIGADILISTIPVDDFSNLIFNNGNGSMEEHNLGLEWRGVRLLFILLEEDIGTKSETYYFPTLDMVIGRVSEIKKYSPYLNLFLKGTFLTIEIPTSKGDRICGMDDGELLDICVKDLIKAGILTSYPHVSKYFSYKFDKVYPVYQHGWKKDFYKIYDRLNEIENIFTMGRGGLFLHCNMDHCITQALELSGIILENKWHNKEAWNKRVGRFLKFGARD